MSLVDRKLCAGCGEPNLESDLCCWACGGSRFAPVNARLAGEPTVYIGEALDRTHEWERDRSRWMPLVYLGAAAAFALFMCILGFWIGRSSAPEPTVAQAPVTPIQPIALPTPPTALSSPAPILAPPPTAFSGPHPAPSFVPDPPVRVRSLEPAPSPRRTPASPPNVAPSTVVTGSPQRQAPPPARVTTIYNFGQDPAPAAPPPAQPKLPAATGKTSVVSLRNETGGSIEIAFQGPSSRTARIAPGSLLPLVLTPGTYEVRVSGGSAAPGTSTAVLTEGKTYGLTVEGQRENGSTRLVIIEPAIDGTGG